MHDDSQIDSAQFSNDEDQWERVVVLFNEWSSRLLRGSMAHFRTASVLEKHDRFWSIVNLIFAITVLFLTVTKGLAGLYNRPTNSDGTVRNYLDAFYNFMDIFSEFTVILIPILSLFVVLTAAFQYISQFPSRAARHNRTAVEYANLRRKLERFWTKKMIHEEAIHSISRNYNLVARFAPIAPDKHWRAVEKDANDQSDRLKESLFKT